MENRIKKLEQILKNDRFANLCDIHLTSIGQGEATAEMIIEEKHLNGVNIIQGGALFTLADFTFAAASNSHGRIAVACQANMNFFKGASSGKTYSFSQRNKLRKNIGKLFRRDYRRTRNKNSPVQRNCFP